LLEARGLLVSSQRTLVRSPCAPCWAAVWGVLRRVRRDPVGDGWEHELLIEADAEVDASTIYLACTVGYLAELRTSQRRKRALLRILDYNGL
jgi:hypothetical protein